MLNFETAYKNHRDLLFGIYCHAFEYLSDHLVIILHRSVFQSVQDGVDIVEPVLGVDSLLLNLLQLFSEIAKTLIEAEGITADIAENGQIALDKFCASAENYYDAILMDIRMPVMDGIEATKKIRNTDRLDAYTVPIIAMSANAFDEDMKKSVECGMNGHLTKPIDMEKGMQAFRRIWSEK